jgi:hypothetical protein
LLSLAAALENLPDSRLLVLVDEYDRFANKLMLENPEAYRRAVQGKSKQLNSSPIRGLFESIKSFDSFPIGCRSFTVGITHIALADASGPNYITNLSNKPHFSGLCGYTDADVERGLALIKPLTEIDQGHAKKLLKAAFDGYRFVGSDKPLYRSQQCTFPEPSSRERSSWAT